MRTRVIAVMELVLIFPAVLFMTALVLRNFQPLQYEPARSAQQLVMWYAGRMWTLWFLLLGLPLIVLEAKRVKKQKFDREDARLLLRLMRENNFPQIWVRVRRIGICDNFSGTGIGWCRCARES
jgi:hypothetical protein